LVRGIQARTRRRLETAIACDNGRRGAAPMQAIVRARDWPARVAQAEARKPFQRTVALQQQEGYSMPLLSHKGATSSYRITTRGFCTHVGQPAPSPYRFGSVVKDWSHKLRLFWVVHAAPGSSPQRAEVNTWTSRPLTNRDCRAVT
jgi:hypothetical protein